MDAATKARLLSYVNNSRKVWGEPELNDLPDDELMFIEIRSDGYANAHVEGEHDAWMTCGYNSARECGERCAAAEWVECH